MSIWLKTIIKNKGQKQQLLRLRFSKTAASDRKSDAPYSSVLQIVFLIESQETAYHLGKTAVAYASQLDFSKAGQQTVNCE